MQGNTNAKKSIAGEEGSVDDGLHIASPPMSPSSPLTYSPQVAMEPLAKADDVLGRAATEFVGAAGWPAQPKLVPVVIVCEYLDHSALGGGATDPRYASEAVPTRCAGCAGSIMHAAGMSGAAWDFSGVLEPQPIFTCPVCARS